MVDPPPWAGGENTTTHPTAQGFFARQSGFLEKIREIGLGT